MAGGIDTWRRQEKSRYRPMHEINVTPFVDVMLVLLIIFMVTAPLLAVGVPIDLPKTQAKPLPEDTQPLAITIDKEGQLYLQDTEVGLREMLARLHAVTESNPDVRIYVRGDRDIAYGAVMELMGVLSAAGFSKVALVTDTAERR